MPFVTEEIYKNFNKGLIMVAKWPDDAKFKISKDDAAAFDDLRAVIGAIRVIRAERNVENKKSLDVAINLDERLKDQVTLIEKSTNSKIVAEASANAAKRLFSIAARMPRISS